MNDKHYPQVCTSGAFATNATEVNFRFADTQFKGNKIIFITLYDVIEKYLKIYIAM